MKISSRLLVMTRTWFVLFCVVFALLTASAFGQAAEWQKIPIPPLHPFHPKVPKRIVLSNGMVIFLQEDHELPFINGMMRIRGGSQEEPAGKIGLVDLYGEVWRTGGTKTETGDQMDDFLESRAAKVETSGGGDSTSLGWSCLKGDFDVVFKMAVELLRDPEFRPDKLDLAQHEAYDDISRRNDNPGQIAARQSLMLAYGANSPYARVAEYKTIAAVTREDLINWHKQYVQPNNIILGVSGDFDSAAMEATLRKAFESWPKGPAAPKEQIPIDPAKPGYYLVTKDDVNQSNIRMVELGTERRNPDYYAIEVFNEAFGGGFSSRLFQDIRTRRGLAYAVGGGIGTAFDHPGVVRIVMSTKSQSTIESIQALYEDIQDLNTHPITETELKRAKDSILNSFIFNFDTPEKVLHERMAYEFYGYPLDFLEKYRDGVEKVTVADVNRIPGKYLHKDKLAVLVVGNTHDFDKSLSTLGAVTNVDITIPPPPPGVAGGEESEGAPPAAPLPTASNAEGKALIAKVADAMGGEAKLKTIHGLLAKLQQQGRPPIEVAILYPDRMHISMESPAGPMAMVVTPQAAFLAAQGQVRDMPESRKQESLAQIKRDLVFIAQHADDPGFAFAGNGTEKIGSVDASILDINAQGTPMRWYVDPSSGRILREVYPATGQSGPVEGQTDLEDWKNFDGVTLPAKRINKQNGENSSVVDFLEIQFNPKVDAKEFEKPATGSNTP
jgi:zinc protease